MSTVQAMLAEFSRVGLTAENWEEAKARHLSNLSADVRLSTREVVALISKLPDGAGPKAVRDAFEAAIARRSTT